MTSIEGNPIERIVIIGGGQAGAQAAQSLRQFGYEGAISLICEEAALPYQRPPLSKAYMKGEFAEERLYFKPLSWFEDNGVEIIRAETAVSIDRETKEVAQKTDRKLPYDALIIATGSRPRQLPVPGADLANVFDLRTLADVDKMRPKMMSGSKIVIIGAGYIGLEAAAVARQLDLEVTVLEMADRVLARVTGPEISKFYSDLHRSHGVDIRLGTKLQSLKGSGGSVTHALLGSGEEIEADLVLSGIGIVPNIELADEAGLVCDNGILVDEDARTSDPFIFAAGDCAVRPLVHYARTGRLESVHNAIEQAKLAAAAIAGRDRPTLACPWFWSDQYDVKLQIAGLSHGYDTVVTRGYPAEKKFAIFYMKDGKLISVDAVNSPPDFIVSKKLIETGKTVSSEVLSDTTKSIKEIAAMAHDPEPAYS